MNNQQELKINYHDRNDHHDHESGNGEYVAMSSTSPKRRRITTPTSPERSRLRSQYGNSLGLLSPPYLGHEQCDRIGTSVSAHHQRCNKIAVQQPSAFLDQDRSSFSLNRFKGDSTPSTTANGWKSSSSSTFTQQQSSSFLPEPFTSIFTENGRSHNGTRQSFTDDRNYGMSQTREIATGSRNFLCDLANDYAFSPSPEKHMTSNGQQSKHESSTEGVAGSRDTARDCPKESEMTELSNKNLSSLRTATKIKQLLDTVTEIKEGQQESVPSVPNITREFARLRLNHASCLVVETPECRRAYEEVLRMHPLNIQYAFESKTLNLRDVSMKGENTRRISIEEEEFRKCLYNSIFLNPNSNVIQVEKVKDPLHPARLSASITRPIFGIKYCKNSDNVRRDKVDDHGVTSSIPVHHGNIVQRHVNETIDKIEVVDQVTNNERDLVHKYMDTDHQMGCTGTVENGHAVHWSDQREIQEFGNEHGNEYPIVLGTLWGIVKEISVEEKTGNLVLVSTIEAVHAHENNTSICPSINTTIRRHLLPRTDWLLGFQIGTHPDISFCATLQPNRFVMDCSQSTTPVFFVNHHESVWGSIVPKQNQSTHQPLKSNRDSVECLPDSVPLNLSDGITPRNSPLRQFSMFGTRPQSPVEFNRNDAQQQQFTLRCPNCRWHVVAVNGFPFLVLTTIPGIELEDGEELLADRGERWQQQRRQLEWPSLWNEFVSKRANSTIRLPLPSFLNEPPRWLNCHVCFQQQLQQQPSIDSQSQLISSSTESFIGSSMLICDGCQRGYHQKCLSTQFNPLPNHDWFCPRCCDFSLRVLGNQIGTFTSRRPSSSPSSHGKSDLDNSVPPVPKFTPPNYMDGSLMLRGDEPPLRRLKPCSECVANSASSTLRNLNVICRLYKRHFHRNADLVPDQDHPGAPDIVTCQCSDHVHSASYYQSHTSCYREALTMAKFIVETVTSSLLASERRNIRIQRQLSQMRDRLNDRFDDGLSPEEIKRAVSFWRSTRQRFELFKKRQEDIAPDALIINDVDNRHKKDTVSKPSFPSTERHSHEQPGQVLLSDLDDRIDEATGSDDDDSHVTQRSRLGRQSSTAIHCRPQSMARSLLRDEFDPHRVAACIDNPVTFNEANATAKSLHPWPRGISWNSKRLTWSVRFWKDDGKTLVATSVPARKHGGVEEAFRKAVALRNRSFIHVLARISAECQSEGRELETLRWSRSHRQWIAEYGNDIGTWSAETEDEVRSKWRMAVQWLIEKGDPNASLIDLDATEQTTVLGTIPRQRVSHHESNINETMNDFEDETMNQFGVRHRSNRRRTTGFTDTANLEDPSEDGFTIDEQQNANTIDAEARRHSHSLAIQALQPFPIGLIWARTTCRFFAVYRDQTSSAIHRKKRFKTFDPKKFGGVNGAFTAASEFLQTVEPWQTKASSGETRRSVVRKPRKKHKFLQTKQSQVGDDGGLASQEDSLKKSFDSSKTQDRCQHQQQLMSISETNETEEIKPSLPVEMDSELNEGDDDDSMVGETNPDVGSSQATSHERQLGQLEKELESLPICNAIQWNKDKRGFLATSDGGRTKWFSCYARNVVTAWHSAFEWIEEQNERSINPIVHKEIDKEQENGEIEKDKEQENGGHQFISEGKVKNQMNHCEADSVMKDNVLQEDKYDKNDLKIQSYCTNGMSDSIIKTTTMDDGMVHDITEEDWVENRGLMRTRRRQNVPLRNLIDPSEWHSESSYEDPDTRNPMIARSARKGRGRRGRGRGNRGRGRGRGGRVVRRRVSSTPLVDDFDYNNLNDCYQQNDSIENFGSGEHENVEGRRSRLDSAIDSVLSRESCESIESNMNYESITPWRMMSTSHRRLAEHVQQIEDLHLYESDDSSRDLNDQARRLQKFSNISWVPQKQAFSVFYTKDINTHNKTTKAFNPIHYRGVKRAYKQACYFGLQMMERRCHNNIGTDDDDNSEDENNDLILNDNNNENNEPDSYDSIIQDY